MADRFDLMTLPPQSTRSQAVARAIKWRKGLYAATPGTGPTGETCRTCKHLVRKQLASVYRKCGLCRPWWTGGGGTDVLAGAPACMKWERSSRDDDANPA